MSSSGNGLMSIVIVGFATSMLFFTSAGAQQNGKEAFAQAAALANMFEIEAAKLAIERGKDEPAKQFARDMVLNHTKVGVDLEAAAREDQPTDGT